LSAFLKLVLQRPLYAFVAKHNVGSRRVLEKCGFALEAEETEGFLLKLNADEQSETPSA
jgi:RimJ/RimL family protein N-acetyltransferase